MKTKMLSFRATGTEKDRINEAAAKEGLTASDYIRSRLENKETDGYTDIRRLDRMDLIAERLFEMERLAFEQGFEKIGLDIEQNVMLLNNILKTIYESENFQRLRSGRH